jgi:hypothetical protein
LCFNQVSDEGSVDSFHALDWNKHGTGCKWDAMGAAS